MKMASIDRSRTSSYSSFIVNMSLSSTVTEIFTVEYWMTLKSGLGEYIFSIFASLSAINTRFTAAW